MASDVQDHVLRRGPAAELAGQIHRDVLGIEHFPRQSGDYLDRVGAADPDRAGAKSTRIRRVQIRTNDQFARKGIVLEHHLMDDPGARLPETAAVFRRRGAKEVVNLLALIEGSPQIGLAIGPRLNKMVAVDRGRHRDAVTLCLHELQHAALAKHILKNHAIGTEGEIAVAWLQFLRFGGVEMAEQHFVRKRQRLLHSTADDGEVLPHRRVEFGCHVGRGFDRNHCLVPLCSERGENSLRRTDELLYGDSNIHIYWIWQMELRHLRYFIAVAEEKHVTRAAERLGMQQPPLSQQIRALERELDVQLFSRKPRGVELTDAGSALLADARAILAHIDHAFATAKRTARGEQGQIAIGLTSSAPFHRFVPRIIRAYRKAFPLVSLTLEESGTTELVDHLRNEQIDAAFIRTAIPNQEGLVVNLLLQEAMVLALPHGHILARRGSANKALHLKALSDETFIVYRRHNGPGLYDAILSACNAAGFSPRIGQEAPRIVSTLNLVAAGLGISLVPESLQHMRMDGVVFRGLSGAIQPKAPLYLASRRGETSSAVRKFLGLVLRPAHKV